MKEQGIFGDEFEKMKTLSNRIFWKKYLQLKVKNEESFYFDFLLFLDTLNILEQKILWLYISGYNQSEIGKLYHKRQQRISEILTKIKLNFLKKIR